MPTFTGQVKDNQIILISAISISGDAQPNPKPYDSLLDTGAQGTLISERVVNEVGLSAIGYAEIMPVHGEPISTKKYRIRIDLPISSGIVLPGGNVGTETILRGMDLDVALLPYQPANHDVLLGMDFLSVFHLTLFGNGFIMSN